LTRFDVEIRSQPEAVARFLDRQADVAEAVGSELRGAAIDWVMIAARGSSDNAARYGQYVLGIRNRLPVALATPSLFTVYQSPPRLAGALVIGISQSGASPDVVAVIEEACRQGCRTLAITADTTSPLARCADYTLDLGVTEKAIAATMTYTTSLAAMALLSTSLGEHGDGLGQIGAVPKAMQRVVEQAESDTGPDSLHAAGDWTVVARGYNYGTAFETALKLTEVARIAVEPYSTADFRHGPIAGIDEESTVVLIAPKGPVMAGTADLIPELAQRHASLVAISDDNDILHAARWASPLPGGVPEWLSPLVAVIPGQILALRLAEAQGLDPDHPRGLRKVTETY